MHKLSLWVLSLLLFAGCSSVKLNQAQTEVRNSFVSKDYNNTVNLLESMDKKHIYGRKDRVLMELEKGAAYHFAGNYKRSFASFEGAEKSIEDNYTKSISRAIKSFLINDNELAYDGEDYEDVYLNAFNALNFIHLGKLSDAQVEARRMSYKLEHLETKYKGLVEALSKKDTTGKVSWELGKADIQNSAFSHYLSAVLFSKMDNPDDARIEYDKFSDAIHTQSALAAGYYPVKGQLSQLQQPGSFNTLIVSFCGLAPNKVENDSRIYLKESDTYVKFAFPRLVTYQSAVHHVRITEHGKEVPLYLIENMDLVAKEVYKIKEPIIKGRAIVRAILKAVAAKAIEKKARKEGGKWAGLTANILGKIGTEVTEQADLRAWQTLPGKVYSTVMELSPGTHTLTVQYMSRSNSVLFEENKLVKVNDASGLNLLETIYPY